MTSSDPVAVVGLAGRFPGSGADLDLFWENVAAGRDCSADVPAGRWVLPPEKCLDPRVPHPDSVYSLRGYFLDSMPTDPASKPLCSRVVEKVANTPSWKLQ